MQGSWVLEFKRSGALHEAKRKHDGRVGERDDECNNSDIGTMSYHELVVLLLAGNVRHQSSSVRGPAGSGRVDSQRIDSRTER